MCHIVRTLNNTANALTTAITSKEDVYNIHRTLNELGGYTTLVAASKFYDNLDAAIKDIAEHTNKSPKTLKEEVKAYQTKRAIEKKLEEERSALAEAQAQKEEAERLAKQAQQAKDAEEARNIKMKAEAQKIKAESKLKESTEIRHGVKLSKKVETLSPRTARALHQTPEPKKPNTSNGQAKRNEAIYQAKLAKNEQRTSDNITILDRLSEPNTVNINILKRVYEKYPQLKEWTREDVALKAWDRAENRIYQPVLELVDPTMEEMLAVKTKYQEENSLLVKCKRAKEKYPEMFNEDGTKKTYGEREQMNKERVAELALKDEEEANRKRLEAAKEREQDRIVYKIERTSKGKLTADSKREIIKYLRKEGLTDNDIKDICALYSKKK